ncbi:MAG: hypothetical protein ACJAWL_001335 [Motiliproteus sp.]|jgi:hypothetical protein
MIHTQSEQFQSEQHQSEQLRQQYLAAMGVTLWLPRQVLPGAAASPAWHWQAAAPESSGSKPAVAADLTTASVRPATHGAPLRQLVQGTSAAAPVQPAQSAEPPVLPAAAAPEHQAADAVVEAAVDAVVVKPSASPALAVATTATAISTDPAALPSSRSKAVPHFRLAMVSYSDCLVITDLPTRNAQVWSAEHQRLLNAIVAAVGLGGSAQLSGGLHEFQWPLDPRARFDQSEAIARHALEVALAGVLQTSHRVLLLMGESTQRYLLPAAQPAASGQLIEHQGRSALCCHGLNEVLRLPGLKAELWRQLQPLRKLPVGH